jgi:sporulation protein YunB
MMCLRRGPVYGAVKNRLPRRLLSFLTIVFVLFLLLKTFLLLESNLQPTILALAQARAKLIATEAINLAINQNIARDCRYDNLIFTQKDVAGNIVVAEVNNMELARIQTQTTLSVQSALEGIEKEKIKIPLGQVLNSKLLANLGPKIPVTLVPIGTVSAKMQQTFDSAGINVISHQVGIDITATIQIVIPFLKGEVSVNTYTPIVTATFFGRVPETVINLPLPNDFQFPSISGDE